MFMGLQVRQDEVSVPGQVMLLLGSGRQRAAALAVREASTWVEAQLGLICTSCCGAKSL